MDLLEQAGAWRDLAQQAWGVAARLGDPGLRRHMLMVAAGYKGLAERAEFLAATASVANSNEKDTKPIA